MESLLSLAPTLVEIAVTLLKHKGERKTREKLADLLCSVADCISAIAQSIEAEKHPAERCAELNMYVSHLHTLVAEEINEKTADELTFWLKHVDAVPGFARIDLGREIAAGLRPKWSKRKRLEQSQRVRSVAGTIRAVGNLARV